MGTFYHNLVQHYQTFYQPIKKTLRRDKPISQKYRGDLYKFG